MVTTERQPTNMQSQQQRTDSTYAFSPREESPSPSTKGWIQSSPPFPAWLRFFVSFLCLLLPADLSLLVLLSLLLQIFQLWPTSCLASLWASSPVTTTLGTTVACHSALLFKGICTSLVCMIHCTIVKVAGCGFQRIWIWICALWGQKWPTLANYFSKRPISTKIRV